MIHNSHDLSAVPEGTRQAYFDSPRMQARHNDRPPALGAPGKFLNDNSDRFDVPQGESTHHKVCAPAGNGKAAQVRERRASVQSALGPSVRQHLRAEIDPENTRASRFRLCEPAPRPARSIEKKPP